MDKKWEDLELEMKINNLQAQYLLRLLEIQQMERILRPNGK